MFVYSFYYLNVCWLLSLRRNGRGLHHAGHTAHAAHATHAGHAATHSAHATHTVVMVVMVIVFLFFGGNLGDQRLGGEQQGEATLAAFCNAVRTTLAGSITPAATRSS